MAEFRDAAERLARAIGFDQGDEDAAEWRERYYRCHERADYAAEVISGLREALEEIAAGRDIDVNGEYVIRNAPLNANDARNIARRALSAAFQDNQDQEAR